MKTPTATVMAMPTIMPPRKWEAAAGLFPVLLPSTNPAVPSITIAESIAGPHTLRVGLVWWTFGTLLAVMYFCIVYWLFRGKVSKHAESYGH
jgi:cytochrome d ubiquinol oxidase subunit II